MKMEKILIAPFQGEIFKGKFLRVNNEKNRKTKFIFSTQFISFRISFVNF